jgi:uncharacterized protein (TIGR02996 family)
VTGFDHPEWESLLRAVVAAPADDVPRLVAADWLDERGQPDRAEFIRVQVELARAEAAGAEVEALRRKERTFLGPMSPTRALWALEACPELVRVEFRERTAAPLEAMRVSGAERLTFRRGFVEAITCPAADWLAHGVRVIERQPVRELTLTDCDVLPLGDWWLMLPALGRVERLTLEQAQGRLLPWLRDQLPRAVLAGGREAMARG